MNPETSSKLDMDLITHMPEAIIQNILERLPIQDAVKTSILSTKWRYKWCSGTQLLFNQHFVQYLDFQILYLKQYHYNKIINRALLLNNRHAPVLKKLALYIPDYFYQFDYLNKWILWVSRKCTQELTIVFALYQKLPTSFFSCLNLKSLSLCNCIVNPPPAFRGFPNLLSLELSKVLFVNHSIEFLLGPRLEKLNLFGIKGVEKVTICCANIRHLDISGFILKLINICYAPKLRALNLSISHPSTANSVTTRSFTITEVLGSLPKVEMLHLDDYIHTYFCAGRIPKKLPVTLECLKHLTLSKVELYNERSGIFAVFCLLYSSPNLEELNIWAVGKSTELHFADFGGELESCTMGGLQIVRITGFLGLRNEMQLIKFILRCSPVLKLLDVAQTGNRNSFIIGKELLSFPRASPLAEISYYPRSFYQYY